MWTLRHELAGKKQWVFGLHNSQGFSRKHTSKTMQCRHLTNFLLMMEPKMAKVGICY